MGLLDRLRATARRRPLVVAGVGGGLTASGAAAGGADLLACYSTACYRVMGLPSALSFLPYADANELVRKALPEVVAASSASSSPAVPVIAGIGAHDPRRTLDDLIDAAARRGAVGVTNEPFVGMYSGDLRTQLEAVGLGFDRELALVRVAVGRGLLALGWAFDPAQAEQMVEAGAPLVGAMIGVSAGGALGSAPEHDLAAGIAMLSGMVRAARARRPDTLVLLHGGPLTGPVEVSQALRATGADGYVAGSTVERGPAVAGVAAAVAAFRNERSA